MPASPALTIDDAIAGAETAEQFAAAVVAATGVPEDDIGEGPDAYPAQLARAARWQIRAGLENLMLLRDASR